MQPEIHLGPLDLQTFGLAFACAFLASGALFSRRLRELGKPADWTYEAVFAALIGGLVGSRLDYIIQNWDDLSGDVDYGEPSDLPWAMSYPEGTVPTTDEVHPTPIYETFTMGLVTLLLWNLRDRLAPGMLFGLYLFLGGLERFLVEFIRRNDEVLAGLTVPQ